MQSLNPRGSSKAVISFLVVLHICSLFDDVVGAIDNRTEENSKEVCYGNLGCFKKRKFSLVTVKPDEVIETKFLLYNRPNTKSDFPLEANEESLKSSTFDPSLETKFITHGYKVTSEELIYYKDVKDSLLKYKSYNVIVMDWTTNNGNSFTQYPKCVVNGEIVGAQQARLVRFLVTKAGISVDSIHFIGHSVGAHVAASAGVRLLDLGGISRTSGLDPAGPLFHDADNFYRLDKSDAKFVDITHTDGGNYLITGDGLLEPLGHIDFYPNGGTSQPGCKVIAPMNSCSHRRVVPLYNESIVSKQCTFIGFECDSYANYNNGKCKGNRQAVMGFHAIKQANTEGKKFYLKTNANSPYCIPNAM